MRDLLHAKIKNWKFKIKIDKIMLSVWAWHGMADNTVKHVNIDKELIR